MTSIDRNAIEGALSNASKSASQVSLVDSRTLGSAGQGGGSFQDAIQALNRQSYSSALTGFLRAIDQGLDDLRIGYSYAQIGDILLNQEDLSGGVSYLAKVFEKPNVLFDSADTAAKKLNIICSELGLTGEALVFSAIADKTTAKLGYSLSPEASEKLRQLVRKIVAS